MSGVFSENIIYVYFLSCIVILSYEKFSRQQKIALIYSTTFALKLFSPISTLVSILLLLAVMFILEEYMSSDDGKLLLVTRLRDKLLDFLFEFIFLDAGCWMIVTLLMCSSEVQEFWRKYDEKDRIYYLVTIILIFISIHILSTSKFCLKTFTEIKKYFDKYVEKELYLNKIETRERLEILQELEDRSYFERKNTYNLLSLEFLKYKIGRRNDYRKTHSKEKFLQKWFRRIRNLKSYGMKFYLNKVKYSLRNRKFSIYHFVTAVFRTIRGCSTLEMQLIRNIAIEKGYTCVVRRKIFEYVYTYLFFGGLKRYYIAKRVQKRNNFKEFILYIYLQNVPFEINDIPFDNIASIFQREEAKVSQVYKMDKEILYAAYLALPGSYVTSKRMLLYPYTVKKHNIDLNKTKEWVNWITNSVEVINDKRLDVALFNKNYDYKKSSIQKKFYTINDSLLPYVESGTCYGEPYWPSYGEQNCWSFAFVVYCHIWGIGFSNQIGTKDDRLYNIKQIDERLITASHAKLYLEKAEPGAVIRLSDEILEDDSSGNMMHSQILLEKNKEGVVIYESTDEKTRIEFWTWDAYAKEYGKYRYFKYIKWPEWI